MTDYKTIQKNVSDTALIMACFKLAALFVIIHSSFNIAVYVSYGVLAYLTVTTFIGFIAVIAYAMIKDDKEKKQLGIEPKTKLYILTSDVVSFTLLLQTYFLSFGIYPLILMGIHGFNMISVLFRQRGK